MRLLFIKKIYMEEIISNINWLAVVVGAVISFILGGFWYSPKMFQKAWIKGTGISPNDKGSVAHPIIVQAIGTFLYAWVIGVTIQMDFLALAILIILTLAILVKANGLFVRKSLAAVRIESGFILVMGIIMILVHMII